MTAAWVAASVRSAALARRRLDPERLRAVAAGPTLDAAVQQLRGTAYGHDLSPGDDLAGAQHAVAATLLWHLRVLAGWAPPPGVRTVRLLASGFEIANVDDHLTRLTRLTRPGWGGRAFELGALESAWSRLARTGTPEELRRTLAGSAWGDPGSIARWDVHVAMSLTWAEQVAAEVPVAAEWARAGAALLLAREALAGRPLPGGGRSAVLTSRLLGPGPEGVLRRTAPAWTDVVTALPRHTRAWVRAADTPEDLWRAEVAWVRRVEQEGTSLVHRGRWGADRVVGAVAVLAVDAWRTRAALEAAARQGGPGADEARALLEEVLDGGR